MKFLVLASVLGVACAGLLDRTYLPPGNAASAGGAAFLSTPLVGSSSVFTPARPVVPILKYTNDNQGDGAYSYSYETGDGTSAQEQGSLRNAGTDAEAIAAQGSYSYTGPDGQVYTVNYIADENGFRAEGAHLPTPPPIPEAIARSLEVIAAAEAAKARQPQGFASNQQGYAYNAPPSKQYLPAQ